MKSASGKSVSRKSVAKVGGRLGRSSVGEMGRILEIVRRKALEDGSSSSVVPFLGFIRASQPSLLRRGILTPSICLIVQGRKQIHIGKEIINYGVGDYIVATVDMPSAGQIVGASKAAPYFGVRLDLDPKEIASIIIEAKIELSTSSRKPVSGAFIGRSNSELREAFLKLLKVLEKPQDAAFLASSIKREIIYRLLTGEYGYLLYQNILLDNHDAGIGKAIGWIKDNFNRPLKMEQLAKAVNMSVSSLHHKFKAVTTMGPLQYQKQMRLQEARRLLLTGTVDASTAAYQVGYESQSQFTREYRRFFGAPPMKDVKTLGQKADFESLQN